MHRFILKPTGGVGLKRISAAIEDLAEALDIPEDILLCSERVVVTAGKRVTVENHRGILSYGEERMIIRLPRGRLAVNGSEMRLLAMTGDTLVIAGRIQSVEWE